MIITTPSDTSKSNSYEKNKKKRKTIGYLIKHLHHRYQSMILPGIMDEAVKRDYNTIGFVGKSINSPSLFENQENVIYELAGKKNIDGLIIFSGAIGNYITVEELKSFCYQYKTSIPMVCISTPIEGIPSVWVDSNGIREIVTHFIKVHNYKRIAFIKGPSKNPEAELRFNLFKEVLNENNIPLVPDLICEGEFILISGTDAVKTLMDERKIKFDAIIAANDEMLIGAYRELVHRGIRIPEDVALGGFDNIDETKIITPQITTVAQPLYEEGRKALELIGDLIEGKPVPELYTFPSHLIIRESCGCQFKNETINYEIIPGSSKNKTQDVIINKEKQNSILEYLIGDIEIQSDAPKEFIEYKDFIKLYLDNFIKDIEDENGNKFLEEISKLTDSSQEINFNHDFFKILIRKIYQYVLPFLGNSHKLTSRAYDLYNSALYKLLDSLSRHNKNMLIQSRDYNWSMLNVTKILSTTFDLKNLREVIIKLLPTLNISYCFIALYENSLKSRSIPTQKSRAFLYYQIDKQDYDYKKKVVFDSMVLIPDNFLDKNNKFDIIMLPLVIENDHFGFIAFDYIHNRYPIIYETLQGHISSSLKETNLIETVKRQSKNLFIQKNKLKNLESLRRILGGFINSMSLIVEARDPYTAGHQVRVADLARSIATEIGLPKNQIEGIRVSAVLHDLGKIYVPSQILNKQGPLIDVEFSLIKLHPQIGYNFLKSIDFPWPVAEIILQHHERIDGSGYPSGLKKDEILIEAQIISVADVVEAMASHRPYRPANNIDNALEEIIRNRGKLYDPAIVDCCVKLFKEKGYKFKEYVNAYMYPLTYNK